MYSLILMFSTEISYRRKYIFNQILFIVSSYAFALGIILSTEENTNILFWFIMVICLSRVHEFYYESVKSDVISTIINSRMKLLIYVLKFSLVVYFISLIIALPFIIYFYTDISLLVYIFTSLLVLTTLLSVIISYLTIIYKRTSILLSICTMYILFYSGFVFDNSNIKIQILKPLRYNQLAIYNIYGLCVALTVTLIICRVVSNAILKNGIQR